MFLKQGFKNLVKAFFYVLTLQTNKQILVYHCVSQLQVILREGAAQDWAIESCPEAIDSLY